MSDEQIRTDERLERRDRRSLLAWIGVLTGPAAWGLELFWSWAIGEFIGCGRGNSMPGQVFTLSLGTFTALMNGVLLGLTILSGILSFVQLRSLRSRTDRTPADRATWLAGAGVMTSILFSILIAASYVPVAMISGCGAT